MFHAGLGIDSNYRIFKNASELSGRAPMLMLSGLTGEYGLKGELIAKIEFMGPTGSIKDRSAPFMLSHSAAASGGNANGVVSYGEGDICLALAGVCAQSGCPLKVFLTDDTDEEVMDRLAGYKAAIETRPAGTDIRELGRAAKQAAEDMGAVFLDEFTDPHAPEAYRESMGPEILADTYTKLTHFICPVGTGSALTGVGEVLKAFDDRIKITAVEPASSPVLSGGHPGPHTVPGMGFGFFPRMLDVTVMDNVIAVELSRAEECRADVKRLDCIDCGLSSGAAIAAAVEEMRASDNSRTRAVVVLDR